MYWSMSMVNQVLTENESQMSVLSKQSELFENSYCKGKNSQCKISMNTASPVGRLK